MYSRAVARRDAPRYDVPPAVVGGALGLLLALFLPLSHRTPEWPAELPHLTCDESAVIAEHRRDLARPLPPSFAAVDRAWTRWSRAAAAGDPARSDAARQDFADTLRHAATQGADVSIALRARAAQRFLDDLERPDAPLSIVAARHGLGPRGQWYATRATRLAWFALRWERNAAPVADDGRVEPLTDSLMRISPSYQRAFLSWALDARCTELIGATEARPITPADVRACANFRGDLVPIARAVDPRYPDEESRAAVDVLLARGLRDLTRGPDDAPVTVADDPAEIAARSDAQAALVRARDVYAAMLERQRTPRIERRYMAVIADLGADEP